MKSSDKVSTETLQNSSNQNIQKQLMCEETRTQQLNAIMQKISISFRPVTLRDFSYHIVSS